MKRPWVLLKFVYRALCRAYLPLDVLKRSLRISVSVQLARFTQCAINPFLIYSLYVQPSQVLRKSVCRVVTDASEAPAQWRSAPLAKNKRKSSRTLTKPMAFCYWSTTIANGITQERELLATNSLL